MKVWTDAKNVVRGLTSVLKPEKCVLLVWVEEAKILHDDGHKEIENDVGDDDVETAEESDGRYEVSAVCPITSLVTNTWFSFVCSFLT